LRGDIVSYINRDSLYPAQQVVENIYEHGDKLPEQPESGRKVPELDVPLMTKLSHSLNDIIENPVLPVHLLFGFTGSLCGKRIIRPVVPFVFST
jgi:hypothetical protein